MDHERLESHLPIDRPGGAVQSAYQITYRSYLEAIKAVILQKWDQILEVFTELLPDSDHRIEEIRIIAEKHGSDYHPARISIQTERSTVSFVMNVALTDRGKERLAGDFNILRHMGGELPARFVPSVYFLSEDIDPTPIGKNMRISMFLAEWFDEFHEFHISDVADTKDRRVVLWDTKDGYRALSSSDSQAIYRQTATILTYYYNVEDFSEIFPWHHAAGDFIASIVGEELRVKLITVRQYAPRVSFPQSTDDNQLDALLLFFANLTIRNRLDRLDGVHEIVWADNHCLRATVQGFLDGLRMKMDSRMCGAGLLSQCRKSLSSLSPVDLTQLFASVVGSYDPASPDMPVITDNLADHILQVYKTIQQISEGL